MIATQFDHAHAVKPTDSFDARSLQGKSVVITGAASGIGEACMRSFVSAGAFVTFGDLAEDRGHALVSELGQDKVAFVKCNTRVWEDQASLFKTASERSPSRGVDIVLANAGITGLDSVFQDQSDPVTGEPVKPNLAIVETNLIGALYTTKLALHYFSRQPEGPGRDRCLLMTSSMAGYADHNGAPQYSAAKWGVRGMMGSLRQVLPKQNARVNIISPWFIGTRILSNAALDKLAAHKIPLAQVEDAALAVTHLASDSRINGRALAIMPRELTAGGYVDLGLDDAEAGGIVAGVQPIVDRLSLRVETN